MEGCERLQRFAIDDSAVLSPNYQIHWLISTMHVFSPTKTNYREGFKDNEITGFFVSSDIGAGHGQSFRAAAGRSTRKLMQGTKTICFVCMIDHAITRMGTTVRDPDSGDMQEQRWGIAKATRICAMALESGSARGKDVRHASSHA